MALDYQMSDFVRIRIYNVGLGDCILVSVPGVKREKHILIDFGSTRGKNKEYLERVKDHIIETVNSDPLAIVLTHGHLDHFKGLYHFIDEFDKITSVFLTTKYLRTPETRRLGTREGPVLRALDERLERLKVLVDQGNLDDESMKLASERLTTDEMIDRLCKRLGSRVRYLDRESRVVLAKFLAGTMAKAHILSPEPSEESYLRFAFGKPLENKGIGGGLILKKIRDKIANRSETSFRELLMREREYDNATSLVILLNWRGKRVLFAGDAQESSWKTMYDNGLLEPIDVLKVAHHASHNGTPVDHPDIWSKMIGSKKPIFLVSTYPRKDWGMPSRDLLQRLESTGMVYSTEELEGSPAFIDIEI